MQEDLMAMLEPLRGTWGGEGSGNYPTIDAFRYAEHLTFEFAASYPLIHYEQRTVLLPGREPSHWESGFIRPLENGRVEVSNSQDSGRVEVLRGPVESLPGDPGGLRLLLEHVILAHDERLAGSQRLLTVAGDSLTYVTSMATHTTDAPMMQEHLSATLKRIQG